MELEMFVDGKFIDAISFTAAQINQLHTLQKKLEKKHCHDLEYSDTQPQFFVTGIPSGLDFEEREKLKASLDHL